jgi:pimeloyl-ACP methyl ester carboxylesterase
VKAAVEIDESPLAPGIRPVQIHYREWGRGTPLVLLHGGWGYDVYPFDSQVERFRDRHRILAPDRSGFGQSTKIDQLPPQFHKAAALETLLVLDRLGIQEAIFWGHSDGAVIAAIIGLMTPARALGLILEAFHYDRNKKNSVEFFESLVREPEKIGRRASAAMARDHGDPYWRKVLEAGGKAWLKIIQESDDPRKDFYDNSLSKLGVPAIFIHGARDPRTQPGELDAVKAQLPQASMVLIDTAGHSPHCEPVAWPECNEIAARFLDRIQAATNE